MATDTVKVTKISNNNNVNVVVVDVDDDDDDVFTRKVQLSEQSSAISPLQVIVNSGNQQRKEQKHHTSPEAAINFIVGYVLI